ncbi:MAG TPA: STAS-like domain-containing protein [Mariprofundaceae bacterium]|nr:STAS-like domain-containing protein [Mariprofundaceae bacterium]
MKTANENTLIVTRDFSITPGSRYISEGDFSGEEFRQGTLEPKVRTTIENGTELLIDLDGTAGYGTSFLEEAFGGLIRANGYSYDDLIAHLKFKSDEEPYLIEDILEYIKDARDSV